MSGLLRGKIVVIVGLRECGVNGKRAKFCITIFIKYRILSQVRD